jgi:hypothetical protein
VGAFNYFLCYAGSASANRQFPIAGQIALNVDATSCADSVGAFCITPLKILGANYAPGVALSFVWTDIKAQVSPPGGWHHEQQRFGQRPRRDRVLAAGAKLEGVDQQPARGFFRRHLRAFRRIPEESACQRLGYWTFEPGLLVSYLGQKSGFDFTTYIGYEIQHEEHGNGLPQWTGLPH